MRLALVHLFICFFSSCNGQENYGAAKLALVKEIPMPSVKGRIDHMALNPRSRVLYIAALGNNTVEVVNLEKGSLIHSIEGIKEPQGLAYLPEQDEIAVASGGTGDCLFFNANTFRKLATIHLAGDADNVRYDTAKKKLYVGYGNGGIAIIDVVAHQQIGDVKLPGHPESFQIDKKNNKIYVNVPGDHSIVSIDLKQLRISDIWKTNTYSGNFPMALDTSSNLIFVGFRHPAVLVAYNALNGDEVSSHELVGDVDDLFFYPKKQEIIASGGGGSLNIFKIERNKILNKNADIPTRKGARTSLLLPSLQIFILAVRAGGDKNAVVAIYKIKD